jgi:hypothetical protein
MTDVKAVCVVNLPSEVCDIVYWMINNDPNYIANQQKAIVQLLVLGAQKLYADGLNNAEPLPKEIEEAMAELSRQALQKVLTEE